MVVELLRECFGVVLPEDAKVTLDSGDFGEPEVYERRGDTALLVRVADNPAGHALVVESQLEFVQKKLRRWAVYSSTLADRNDCDVDVVVFCPKQRTADQYDRPYHLGNRFVLHPYVLGPKRVPVVNDSAKVACAPELAVLSAVAHGRRDGVLDALLTGFADIDPERARSYTELLLGLLDGADRTYVEEAVAVETFRYQSEFTERLKAEGEAKGKAEGEARSVVAVLEARGLVVDEAVRERIVATTDLDLLDTWVRRAVSVDSAEQLFD
jgi:hypothetical protein